jgi:hypothetical protein
VRVRLHRRRMILRPFRLLDQAEHLLPRGLANPSARFRCLPLSFPARVRRVGRLAPAPGPWDWPLVGVAAGAGLWEDTGRARAPVAGWHEDAGGDALAEVLTVNGAARAEAAAQAGECGAGGGFGLNVIFH